MDERVQRIVDYFNGVSGPFRLYPNPMRDDGMFVGQDKELKPYPNVRSMSGPLYPATPIGAKMYPGQVPHDIGIKAIEMMNNKED